MLINNKYNIGDCVYLKTDREQFQRCVTAIQINDNGILYRVIAGTIETWHYDFEISIEKNVIEIQERNLIKEQ